MSAVDMNNADQIREKTNSLNAQKITNINNLVQHQQWSEKKKSYCNNELKKHVSILFIILFLLTLVGSTIVFCFITFTNKFNEGIVENLVLKNNTKSMEWWINSPIQPLLKIYVFNYTNIDDYLLNPTNKKIKIEQAGPYVYKEYGSRVNLQFDDQKITFNDNKTLVFMRSLSSGPEEDIAKVPNIPLLAALTTLNSKKLSTGEEIGLKSIFKISHPKEFHDKTIKEFMFGYTDSFVSTLPAMTPERAGLISGRKGVSIDNLTIYTGEDTLENLGRIHAMNSQTKMSIWNSDECNNIVGTDGSQFPPHLMDKDEELKIFIKSFCRTLTLKYDREVTVLNGIPAWRYRTPKGEFGSSRTNPNNKCYCDSETDQTCPPDGVFDASKCLDGIPLLISYPHFLEGNETLRKHFEGLKPKRKAHGTFADIHARMAFPIGGASRLQMNFRVSPKFPSFFSNENYYTKLPKDLILPIFWIEVTAGDIPAEFQKLVFHTTQSANATYLAIQYSSLIGAFVSLLLLLSTSYIYFMRLTRKPAEKIQNKDVIVTFQPSIPTAPTIENGQENKIYPNLSSQSDQNKF